VSRSCSAERNVRIDPKRQRLALVLESIVVPPVPAPIRSHEEIEAESLGDAANLGNPEFHGIYGVS
jgi:hypothetical protein